MTADHQSITLVSGMTGFPATSLTVSGTFGAYYSIGTTGCLSNNPFVAHSTNNDVLLLDAVANCSVTLTVTGSNHASASTTIDVTVTPHAVVANASAQLKSKLLATPFQPVSATGASNTVLHYAVSPALPAGLVIDEATGMISGTPTETSGVATYAVNVTDDGGNSDSGDFMLSVAPPITVSTDIPSTTFQTGEANSFTPLSVTDGTAPYQFAVSPALPAGLSLDTSTGTINGAPLSATPTTTHTMTVTDANGIAATGDFDLEVVTALSATVVNATAHMQIGSSANFTPLAVSDGTAPYMFSVTPALPNGLTFDSATGDIAGTPLAAASAHDYVVHVQDAHGFSVSGQFSLSVSSPLSSATNGGSIVLQAGAAATPFAPITVSGGTGPFSYQINPALPSGLTLDGATGQVSGAPLSAAPATTYAVTVSDAHNFTSQADFDLEVVTALTATVATSTTHLQIGAEAHFTPVTAALGTAPYVFSVTPNLPTGLTLNSSTGEISGTPTASAPAHSYTMHIQDAHGFSALGQFALSVSYAVSLTENVSSIVLQAAIEATPFTPIEATGGTAPYHYQIAPDLPPGLSMNISTGQISGMPSTVSPDVVFIVSVTDSNPVTPETHQASFHLSVSASAKSNEVSGLQQTGSQISAETSATVVHSMLDDMIGSAMGGNFSPFSANEAQVALMVAPGMQTPEGRITPTSDTTSAGVTSGSPWRIWLNGRYTRIGSGNLSGNQLNGLFGVTYLLSPNQLAGLFAGYETFNYSSATGSTFQGNGITVGALVAGTFDDHLKLDGRLLTTLANYNVTSGLATGNLQAHRLGAEVSASYVFKSGPNSISPFIKSSMLMEWQGAYTDSLTTFHAGQYFAEGTLSPGVQFSHTIRLDNGDTFTPYISAAANLTFGNTNLVGFAGQHGIGGRFMGGINYRTAGGTTLGLQADYTGIGRDLLTQTYEATLTIPF
ncbi:putative Ig domain-containing protein [Aestuariivirga litoralis]|uniref:putative Ig domain-containing protein n=1 Tax=Aestuariivirga litoralis TaxID=2650924 RepID=UPI0018C46E7A|nr:putative Ig domain-containing protein [Aestuariivirga litoralis]